jgi:hypothetical protein
MSHSAACHERVHASRVAPLADVTSAPAARSAPVVAPRLAGAGLAPSRIPADPSFGGTTPAAGRPAARPSQIPVARAGKEDGGPRNTSPGFDVARDQAAQRQAGSTALRRILKAPSTTMLLRCGDHACNCGPEERARAELAVSDPHDPVEREADHVAEVVMRTPNHGAQPTSAPRPGGVPTPRLGRNQAVRSDGRSLEPNVRADMEARFGTSFEQVRIHEGHDAWQAAEAVDAKAFTVGDDIVFGRQQYDPVSEPGRRLLAHELAHTLQQAGNAPAILRQAVTRPPATHDPQKTEACPPAEPGEKQEAAKAQLRLVERIPQQEWLIYGFPIGGTAISRAESGGFISSIVKSLRQGHFVYMTGQDSLEVIGFSDCFAGPQVDNHAIRQGRAAEFCAGVKDQYAATPKTYPALIRSCEPAPADQYVGSNATQADRAQNRSILIRRVASKVSFPEGNETFPYDPKFGPSEAHCAAYATDLARDILGPVYTNNAHCSCQVTPDEPHNNCVRHCLQDKMWTLLAYASKDRKANDPPMDINLACPIIWQHHRDCYHDCGCASEFIDYLAFDAVCNIALPCAVDSAAINLLNRCMPATKDDKYQQVP